MNNQNSTKIVYLIPGMYNSGGMERVLSAMVNYLSENWSCKITIITTEQKGRSCFFTLSPKVNLIDLNINFYDNPSENLLEKYYSRISKKKIYKKRLTSTLKELKPDFTVTMFGLDIDFINSLDDGSIKIGNMQFFKDFRSRYLNVRSKNPILRWDAERRNKKMEKEALTLTALTVLTKKDKENWGNLDYIYTIPNPLPFKFESMSLLDNKKVISVGRLSVEKGFDMLVDAWKIVAEKFPDWHLSVYGKGDEEKNLKEQINRLGLNNNITIHAPVLNIKDKYAESSIYVLCSRYEGLPTALLEAMSCGLPSVAFKCMNDPEDMIEDGVDGFLVKKNNINELADRICYLMEDKERRTDMGSKARLRTDEYSIERVMQKWITLFEQLKKTTN